MELCVTYGSLPFPMSPTCTPHSPSLPFSLHSPHIQAATWCRVQEAGARGTLTVGDGRGEEQRAGGKVAQDVEGTTEALPTAAHCAVPETKDHQTTSRAIHEGKGNLTTRNTHLHTHTCTHMHTHMQGMDELDRCHQEQQSSMQGELKKEMALLQKKILMETVS